MSNLNGAYYGPAVPPPKSYHRPGRGGGGCLECCCGCIFNLIFKIILTIIVIVGIAALVVWLVLRPNAVKVHVTEASLSQFEYTGNNSNSNLRYNLALNISIRNPNKRIGIYYDYIEALALFQDERFSTAMLDTFYQGHKNTTLLSHTFQGQSLVMLGADQASEYTSEKGKGVYDITVKMYLKVRFKVGAFKTRKVKPKVTCNLQVPLTSSNTAFQPTKCHWSR